MKTVTLTDIVKTSFSKFSSNFFKLLGIGFILSLPSIPQNFFGITFEGPLVILEVILGLIQLYLTIGANLFLLDLVRKTPPSFKKFVQFETLKIFPRVLGQYITIIIILLPALLLFLGSLFYISGASKNEQFFIPTTLTTMIIAATIFALSLILLTFVGMSLFLATYLALEKKGLIKNIKTSWKLTQGHRFKLFIVIASFSALGAILNATTIFLPLYLAFIPQIISLLMILPLMSLTLITYYDKLSSAGEIPCQQ